MIESIIKPKKPLILKEWLQLEASPYLHPNHIRFLHTKHQLVVISALEVVSDEENRTESEPHYHISVSALTGTGRNKRASSEEAKWVLEQFGIPEAEEDNHAPQGWMRSFWRPVADRLVGKECECKETEPAILLDRGNYIWRPKV